MPHNNPSPLALWVPSGHEIVEKFSANHPCVKLLANPKRVFPAAVNIGLREAKGEIIQLMGAHAGLSAQDYLSMSVHFLAESNADCVGGVLQTVPSDDTAVAKAIALALSHPFGAGNSYYRIGSKAPRWVDTVFGGCFKREVFQKIGFFNHELFNAGT